jgi:toluene monooxygenase system protein A
MNTVARDTWLPLARRLDWEFSYVPEEEVFPEAWSGTPRLTAQLWQQWNDAASTTYTDYVIMQDEKNHCVQRARAAMHNAEAGEKLGMAWKSAVKLHSAILPLAEFAAVIANLRAARFARASEWRLVSLFAALDETRHTQIPLLLMSELVGSDPQFDWTLKFYHTNNWVAIAARHFADELLLTANPIEMAIATNFVFETGFTNMQFVGLSSVAHEAGDETFATINQSIQSDEARHSQMGLPVLRLLLHYDRDYVQYLLDKWFWRSWQLFAIVTGFSMDYFSPLETRSTSFKEFMEEWVIGQFVQTLENFGLKRPWYWPLFLQAIDSYHHMVYVSAYSYRATVWFNFALPSPEERGWLRSKYSAHWDDIEQVWQRIDQRWERADVGNDFAVHGTSIIGFCNLCQIVLCGGTPRQNTAVVQVHKGRKYIFCSEVCRWIFNQEPLRYEQHLDVVQRVLAGLAPGNIVALLRNFFGLSFASWGKDIYAGEYPWIKRPSEEERRARGSSHL